MRVVVCVVLGVAVVDADVGVVIAGVVGDVVVIVVLEVVCWCC